MLPQQRVVAMLFVLKCMRCFADWLVMMTMMMMMMTMVVGHHRNANCT